MPRLGSAIPLVARGAELETLRAALARAVVGRAGALLLSGDAGVGKSRLLAELLEGAHAGGWVVLTGRCLDAAEATLPYLPFAEVVGQLAEHDTELVEGHTALRRLLLAEAPATDDGSGERGLGQLQLFEALHVALGRLTAEQPTVLAIEDLHWADRSSRDLLAFLLSRLAEQRLLVIVTVRSDDLHRRHPLRPLLAELVRLSVVDRLHLDPFTPDDTRAFVRSLGDRQLADDVVSDIVARSEGNAFIAEELVSASGGEVPQELAEVLLARVEQLSAVAQRTVRLAAVVGRRFTHDRLSSAADIPAAELDAALREAVLHGVLVAEDGASYAFRHALLREAVYGDLLPGERARLHGQVAAALAGDESPGAAAALAYHNRESHDLAGALAASVRAAREADRLGAPAELLAHTERALELWSVVDDPERIAGADELELRRGAAYAAGASGEPHRAIAHSRSAIELADTRGDAWASVEVRRRYASYLLTLDGNVEQAYDVAREAWRLVADAEPSAEKAWVQATLAGAALRGGKDDEVAELASAAIETARAVPGDGPQTAAHADALITKTVQLDRRSGSVEQALDRFAEASTLARSVHADEVELRALYSRATTRLDDGQLSAVLVELDTAVERAASIGLTWSAYGLELRVLQVIVRFLVGDWDGAETAAELAGEGASGTVSTRVSAAGLLVAVGRGGFDVADRRLAYLRDRWRLDQQVLTLVGLCGAELELWRGRPRDAIWYAEQALTRVREAEPWNVVAFSLIAPGIAAYAKVAEAARAAGDEDAERRAVRAGEALLAQAVDTMTNARPQSAKVGPEGIAWLRRVEAEATRLRGPGDPDAWRSVVDTFGYGEPYRQAYGRWRLAGALLASGDPPGREEAAEQLRRATAVAAELRAEPLREAVVELAGRARIGLDPGAATAAPADLLTQREQAVLALVAAGRTNRQIGAELFISDKTVSVHVSRVLAKLDVASRTEAVSAAYTRGLLVRE